MGNNRPLRRETLLFRAFYNISVARMRGVNDNIWIDCTLSNCDEDCIVAIVAFPNEAKAVKARGGIVIKVVRPDAKASDSHQSETLIDDIGCGLFDLERHDLGKLGGKCR